MMEKCRKRHVLGMFSRWFWMGLNSWILTQTARRNRPSNSLKSHPEGVTSNLRKGTNYPFRKPLLTPTASPAWAWSTSLETQASVCPFQIVGFKLWNAKIASLVFNRINLQYYILSFRNPCSGCPFYYWTLALVLCRVVLFRNALDSSSFCLFHVLLFRVVPRWFQLRRSMIVPFVHFPLYAFSNIWFPMFGF